MNIMKDRDRRGHCASGVAWRNTWRWRLKWWDGPSTYQRRADGQTTMFHGGHLLRVPSLNIHCDRWIIATKELIKTSGVNKCWRRQVWSVDTRYRQAPACVGTQQSVTRNRFVAGTRPRPSSLRSLSWHVRQSADPAGTAGHSTNIALMTCSIHQARDHFHRRLHCRHRAASLNLVLSNLNGIDLLDYWDSVGNYSFSMDRK